MTFSWADLVWVVATAVAGGATGYWLAMRKMRRAIAESHRETERRLQALTEAFSMSEPATAESVSSTDVLEPEEIEEKPVFSMQGRPLPRIVFPTQPVQEESEEIVPEAIAPEIRAAIAAAAIAVFGSHARVRGARRVPSRDVVSPWTQQGRVLVQSSHNLRTRGR